MTTVAEKHTTKTNKPSLPVSTPETMDPVFTVPAREFAGVLKRISTMSSNDWTLPMINGVHLQRRGNRMVVAATDRFRIGLTTMDVQWQDGVAEDWKLLLPLDLVKKIVAGWRTTHAAGTVTLSLSQEQPDGSRFRRCVIQDLRGESNGSEVDPTSKFPDTEQLLQDAESRNSDQPPASGAIAFNFDYLVAFEALRAHKGETISIRWPEQPSKPVLFFIGHHSVGLLMPIRTVEDLSLEQVLSGTH